MGSLATQLNLLGREGGSWRAPELDLLTVLDGFDPAARP